VRFPPVRAGKRGELRNAIVAHVSPLEFITIVAEIFVWPVTSVFVILLFRRRIEALLGNRLQRVKAGPLELHWSQVVAETQVAVDLDEADRAEEVGSSADPTATSDAASTDESAPTGEWWLRPVERKLPVLYKYVEESPDLAVIGGWILVERYLHEAVESRRAKLPPGPRGSVVELLDIARRGHLLSYELASAVDGLRRLRNHVIHVNEPTTPERARQYLDLVGEVLESLLRLTVRGESMGDPL
jgi:hypothetical protein